MRALATTLNYGWDNPLRQRGICRLLQRFRLRLRQQMHEGVPRYQQARGLTYTKRASGLE